MPARTRKQVLYNIITYTAITVEGIFDDYIELYHLTAFLVVLLLTDYVPNLISKHSHNMHNALLLYDVHVCPLDIKMLHIYILSIVPFSEHRRTQNILHTDEPSTSIFSLDHWKTGYTKRGWKRIYAFNSSVKHPIHNPVATIILQAG